MTGILALCAGLLLPAMGAAAHGEKSQPAGLRMSTIHWYDADISKSKVAVNQTLVLKGRFYVSNAWPESMPNPVIAFLHTASPEPGLMRIETKINGLTQTKPIRLEIGKHYKYEMLLKARAPGRAHVHGVLHINDAGPLIGPGKWVETTGDAADFSPPVKANSGPEFTIETYAIDDVVPWQMIMSVLAVLWVLYWVAIKGPVLRPGEHREAGLVEKADQRITRIDLLFGAAALLTTIGIMVGSYIWAGGNNPFRTPSRTGVVELDPLPDPPKMVDAKLKRALYNVPGRSFQMEVEVTNDTDTPLALGEVSSSYVRFINPDVIKNIQTDDLDEPIAMDGLIVEGGTIGPGVTKTVMVRAADAIWETERLSEFATTSQNPFSALMHFYTPSGKRIIIEITGSLTPS